MDSGIIEGLLLVLVALNLGQLVVSAYALSQKRDTAPPTPPTLSDAAKQEIRTRLRERIRPGRELLKARLAARARDAKVD